MNWKKKDWIDLLLMSSGAVFGGYFFGFLAHATLGLELFNGMASTMLAAAAGVIFGYALRFIFWRLCICKCFSE